MNNKFFMNLKLAIKFIFISLGFKINKISEKERLIQKINIIEDNSKRVSLLQKAILKYPKDPHLQLMLFEACLETNHPDFNKNLKLYHNKNINYDKTNTAKKIDAEFVPLLIFLGALGNTLQLRTLIDANNLNLRNKKKLYLFWPKNFKPNNSILFEYFKDFINLIEDEEEFKNLYNASLRQEVPLRVCLNFKEFALTIPHSSNFVETFKKENSIVDRPFFNLKKQHKVSGEKELEKVNVPPNSWYVTLHIREPEKGYRGETPNNTTEKFRNADPNNYIKAINTIIAKGGYVFRMGHPGITPMPKIPGLIDYANSKIKSELMDVFLGATCKFCIGNSSGYHAIPSFFSIPRLLTDIPNHNVYFFLKEFDLYLPRLFLKSDGKKMTFREMFSYPFNALGHDESYKKFKISPIHNTPEEIDEATKEMIIKTIDKKELTNTNEQLKFKQIIKNTSFDQTNIKFSNLADISPNFLTQNLNLLQ